MAQGQIKTQNTPMGGLMQVLQYEREGAPLALIQLLMLEGAEELANACVATLDIEIKGDPAVEDYDFSHCIPDGLEVASVETVIVCGECLRPYEKCTACPRGWKLVTPTCVRMKPCPPEGFTVCVVLRPTQMCNELPDCFARHRRFFHHYVSGRLALMSNEDWGNSSEARYNLRRADAIKNSTAVKEVRGNSSANRNNNDAGCLI